MYHVIAWHENKTPPAWLVFGVRCSVSFSHPLVQVGGYLAFIGLFCLEAALGLSSGKDIQGVDTWGLLLDTRYGA